MEGEGDEEESKRSKPTIPSLPQELIIAILVRLPVKYLLQFKCVSQYWLSLISSPEFVKTHLSFSAKDHTRHSVLLKETKYPPLETILKHCSVTSLFNESVAEAMKPQYQHISNAEALHLDFPMKNINTCADIVGSVNGLICLRIRSRVLFMWNPSTRKFKQLPQLKLSAPLSEPRYAFGYDEVHDDYKVVAISSIISTGYVDAKIYSLKSDSWRILDDFQPVMVNVGLGLTKFVNGKLHGVTSVKDIISIDLVDEKFGKVEHPCYAEGEFSLNLGVLGSDLSVLCNYQHKHSQRSRDYVTHTDVWVMKEYGFKESWTKLYTIKYPDDLDVVPKPVFMSNKGEIVLLLRAHLMLYNPEDESFRYSGNTNGFRFEAEVYFESLVCPILQNKRMTLH